MMRHTPVGLLTTLLATLPLVNGLTLPAERPAARWPVAAVDTPPSRVFGATAFDARRGRLVLFGGVQSGNILDDTWEWDGRTWVEMHPSSHPSARGGHAMAWHAGSGKILLFGGGSSDDRLFQDTWEWDGQGWAEREVREPPSARLGHTLAFDATRGRVVLFGGQDSLGPVNDLWEWDGKEWVVRIPLAANRGAMLQRRGLLAAMENDLRNLATAMEAYYLDSSRYAPMIEALNFDPSEGVTIVLTHAADDAWAAVATHGELAGWRCGVFIGNAPPPFTEVTEEAIPECGEGPPLAAVAGLPKEYGVYTRAMKADLRNLVTAMEAYFADNNTYARKLPDVPFTPGTGVRIELSGVSDTGWAAIATNPRLRGVRCGIYVGAGPGPLPEARYEGSPACTLP